MTTCTLERSADPRPAPAPARLGPNRGASGAGGGATGTLGTLQAGRAIAAIVVVLFHASVATLPGDLHAGTAGPRIFDIGEVGVEFFFVLSGFIMYLVHRRDFGQPGRAGRFLWKRFVRIYPVYWLVMAVLVCAYAAFPQMGPENAHDPWRLAQSFLLLPTNGFPVLVVAWTLQHEVLFYAVFIAFLMRPRPGAALFAGWSLACAVCIAPGLRAFIHPFPWHFLFAPFNLLFGFGMVAAIWAERMHPERAVRVFWIGLALFLAAPVSITYGLADWNVGLKTLSVGAGAMLMVAALAAGERKRGWRVPRALCFLGDASYAVYLVHVPAMKFTAPLLLWLGVPDVLAPLPLLALCAAIGIGAGIAVHVMAERPLLDLLSGRRSRGAPASRRAGNSGKRTARFAVRAGRHAVIGGARAARHHRRNRRRLGGRTE